MEKKKKSGKPSKAAIDKLYREIDKGDLTASKGGIDPSGRVAAGRARAQFAE